MRDGRIQVQGSQVKLGMGEGRDLLMVVVVLDLMWYRVFGGCW